MIIGTLLFAAGTLTAQLAKPVKTTLVQESVTSNYAVNCDTCNTCCERIVIETTVRVYKHTYDTCKPKEVIKEIPREMEFPTFPSYKMEPEFIITPMEPTSNCIETKQTWIDKYPDCKKAPEGNYVIQFYFSKLDFLTFKQPTFAFKTEKIDNCGYRFLVSKIFNNYCDAQKYLKLVKAEFPDAFIRKL